MVDDVFEALQSFMHRGLAILLFEQRAKRTVDPAHRSYLLGNGELRLTLGPEDAADTDALVAAYFA
jgi:ABC-type branched-subunit amino acid transport system ATPase component